MYETFRLNGVGLFFTTIAANKNLFINIIDIIVHYYSLCF